MDELGFYLNDSLTQKLKPVNELEPCEAGSTKRQPLYIKNNTDYEMSLTFKIETDDDDVVFQNLPKKIAPHTIHESTIFQKPKLTRMKPIRFTLNVKAEYIIK